MKEKFKQLPDNIRKTIKFTVIFLFVLGLLTIGFIVINIIDNINNLAKESNTITCNKTMDLSYINKSTIENKVFLFDSSKALKRIETTIMTLYTIQDDYIVAKSASENDMGNDEYIYDDENKTITKVNNQNTDNYYEKKSYDDIMNNALQYQYVCSASPFEKPIIKADNKVDEKILLSSPDYVQYELVKISNFKLELIPITLLTGLSQNTIFAEGDINNYNSSKVNIRITISLYDINENQLVQQVLEKEMMKNSKYNLKLLISDDSEIMAKTVYYSIKIENL